MVNSPHSLPAQLPGILDDSPGRRLGWACLVSLVVNGVLWTAASAVIHHHVMQQPRLIQITRVVLRPKRLPVKRRPPQRIVKPTPRSRRVLPRVTPHAVRTVKPTPIRRLAPQRTRLMGAHQHLLTAPAVSMARAAEEYTAPTGGYAPVGVPIDRQAPGSGVTNPAMPEDAANPTAQAAPPATGPGFSTETAPRAAAAPSLPETSIRPVLPPPPAPPAPTPPQSPPIPSGPTRDAAPENEVKPDIPEDLKTQPFKSFVRVKVEIQPDGSFTPILRTSSGNAEIDRRVLEALKQWKWKPALQNGVPIQSTMLFRFEFEVE